MLDLESQIRESLANVFPTLEGYEGDWEAIERELASSKRDVLRRRGTRLVQQWRRTVLLIAGVIVVGLTASIHWWGTGTPGVGSAFAGRAVAAVGRGPVLHVVIASDRQSGTMLNLGNGRRYPVTDRTELWLDGSRRMLTEVDYVNGVVIRRSLFRPGVGYSAPGIDPVIAAFAKGYRNAHAEGQARLGGTGAVAGHHVIWLEFQRLGQQVAVDQTSYRPVAFTSFPGSRTGPELRYVPVIATIPRNAANFVEPPSRTTIAGLQQNPGSAVAPRRAASVLGWTPIWLGRSFGGFTLASSQITRLTASTVAGIGRVPVTDYTIGSEQARGYRLSYSRGAGTITIDESTSPIVVANLMVPAQALPAGGAAALGGPPSETSCVAELRAGSLWVRVQGFANNACTAVVRSLARVGSTIPHEPAAPFSIKTPQPPKPIGAKPTLQNCIDGWNATHSSGPQILRTGRTLAGGSPNHIPVAITVNETSGFVCHFQFLLPHRQTLLVDENWVAGRATAWGTTGQPKQLTRGQTVPTTNASSSAKGIVRLDH
jgi:hypothetical protein